MIRGAKGVIVQNISECFDYSTAKSVLFSPTHRKFASSTTKNNEKKAEIHGSLDLVAGDNVPDFHLGLLMAILLRTS